MSVLTEQIEKAYQRDAGVNVRKIVAASRDAPPEEVASERQKSERLRFLRDTLPTEAEAVDVFERILHGNEIQAINYLAKGARVAEAVARVEIKDGSGRRRGWGSGFLIAPGVLLTNHHVLPDAASAVRSEAQFQYELDLFDRPTGPVGFVLQPERLFFSDEALDFSVVAVAERSERDGVPLQGFGFLPLIGTTGKVADGEWLTVVQHPNGERKQVCVRENKLLKRTQDVLWYSTDTLGGSSGSPVFNNDWYVVALHHSGIPEKRGDTIQTMDGQDYDPQRHSEADIRWIANEGIRVSRIVDTLRTRLPAHPLLQPLLQATPEYARLQLDAAETRSPRERSITTAPSSARRGVENAMHAPPATASRFIDVTLEIDPSGSVHIAPSRAHANESATWHESRSSARELDSELPFDDDYASRTGFDADFIGGGALGVNLPTLNAELLGEAARLRGEPDAYVLKYHNFSVVMHARRRLAIYTAANLDAGRRFDMTRPSDTWRTDPRIAEKAQLGNFYYRNNRFDRGHLTRREDLEYGDTFGQALASAADTCHWTNCTPQHEKFNKNRALWHGLERYILEERIAQDDQLHAQVFTGPLLEGDDPVHDAFPDIQYPVRFWKVVVARRGARALSATAYLLDQSDIIAEHGIEAAREPPFGAFGTFQVTVAEIERLTGLRFTHGDNQPLRDCDPLQDARRKPARQRAKPRLHESARVHDNAPGYVPIDRFESLILD